MRSPATLALATTLLTAAPNTHSWDRFRGPNGTGISEGAKLPAELAPTKNLAWKVETPPGYSSPILTADHVLLTAHEQNNLFTLAINRKTGKISWKTPAPRPLEGKLRGPNSPVSPTPVTDGKSVFIFYGNYGLISYDTRTGKELWHFELAPANNPYGVAASPILAGDTLVLLCDQDTDSFLLGLDKNTGKQKWKQSRPGVTHGFSTPIVHQPKNQPAQILVSGSFRLTSYSAATGEPLWWVDGMAWQAKSCPVIAGDTLYVHSWMASMTELGQPEKLDPWETLAAGFDKNKDNRIEPAEANTEQMKSLFFLFDLNKDNFMDKDEWDMQRRRNEARNGLYAINLAANPKGDVTATQVRWRYDKGLGNLPSPLVYRDIVYALKEGGILTALDPATGQIIKQGRVEGAVDVYRASPVAGDGKIYFASSKGKVAVVQAGRDWKVLNVHDLGEDIWGTPAISRGQIYIRTQNALYCFDNRKT